MNQTAPHSDAEDAAVIPVRSQRLAMEWSLVLASQGIEPIIDRDAENGRWMLLVPRADYERSVSSIQQFRAENRRRVWREQWREARGLWGALVWCGFLAAVYASDAHSGGRLETAGILDSAKARGGDWWRVLTAVTLHGNLGHLASNLSIGLVLFGLAGGRFGVGVSLLLAFVAGVLGNVGGVFLRSEPYRGLGASGMVMGALGLLAAHAFSTWRNDGWASAWSRRLVWSGLGGGTMLFVLFGLHPGSDTLAHALGFAAGLALGGMMALIPTAWTAALWFQHGCGFILSLALGWTWWLASRSPAP
jgi:membrane associated rhomboid family serine protease